jgi:hypothetical protein
MKRVVVVVGAAGTLDAHGVGVLASRGIVLRADDRQHEAGVGSAVTAASKSLRLVALPASMRGVRGMVGPSPEICWL